MVICMGSKYNKDVSVTSGNTQVAALHSSVHIYNMPATGRPHTLSTTREGTLSTDCARLAL